MDNSASPRQTGESRTMIDMDIQGYTEAAASGKFGDESTFRSNLKTPEKQMWTAVRHEIQPRYPVFPARRMLIKKRILLFNGDRILPRDELTYSITNIVTRKGSIVSVTGEGDKQEARRSTFLSGSFALADRERLRL